MGSGLASKMIYYWIFILGGLTITYLLKIVTEGMDFIIMLISLTLVYWGIEFLKFRKMRRSGVQASNTKQSRGSQRNKR
jgi:cytochrome c biogenesis protein CcdA